MTKWPKRLASSFFAHACIAAFVCVLLLEWAIQIAVPPNIFPQNDNTSLVLASDGTVLNGTLTEDDKLRMHVRVQMIDERYLDLLQSYEDQNFMSHGGVDILAMMRAVWQFGRERRIISGGSTITMQLVRLLSPRERTLGAKITEMLIALKIERLYTKEQILGAYLTVIPFGGNIEGVRAAAWTYFGKEPYVLSLNEIAFLLAIPQAPEARRPDRHPRRTLKARNHVINILRDRNLIGKQEATIVLKAPLGLKRTRLPAIATHLGHRLRSDIQHRRSDDQRPEIIRTLLDSNIQIRAERVTARKLANMGDDLNLAVVVIRNEDAAVLTYLGSAAPLSGERHGFVDLADAVRSPGSALKPFVYTMAFDRLDVHPDTIVTDEPINIAGYEPENADSIFSGDLSVRSALIRSKNTVPILLLDKVGVGNFLARFRATGRPLYLASPDSEGGLAIALGGVGVTLEQLTWLYTIFPNQGKLKPLRHTENEGIHQSQAFAGKHAANAVADILADALPPAGYVRLTALDGSRRIGFKTGTSYGFRDAWAIGFDKLHTVGIWVGRPDGGPHLGAYGISVAAPILFDMFEILRRPVNGVPSDSASLGPLVSPRPLPRRLKRFGGEDRGIVIGFPANAVNLHVQREGDGSVTLPLQVRGGHPPYRWRVFDKELPATDRLESKIRISERGQITISVIDDEGQSDTVSFWLN